MQPPIRLTAAQALVRFLGCQWSERDGVRRRAVPGIFGIFGHGNVCGLGPALEEDEGRSLSFHQPKNEQAMVHSAIGYARACNLLSTLACTASIGPGSTNLLTGAATATVNRVPVLLLPSDTFANRRQGPVMQALESPLADLTVNDAFRPLSTFFDRITRPEQLIASLPEAMRVLLEPAETGAVTISLHQDVQAEACDYPTALFEPRTWQAHAPASCGRGAPRGRGRATRLGAPARDSGWRRALLGGAARAGRALRAPRDPGGRDLSGQGRSSGGPTRTGRARCDGHPRGERARPRGGPDSVSRDPADRPYDGLALAIPGPGVSFVG